MCTFSNYRCTPEKLQNIYLTRQPRSWILLFLTDGKSLSVLALTVKIPWQGELEASLPDLRKLQKETTSGRYGAPFIRSILSFKIRIRDSSTGNLPIFWCFWLVICDGNRTSLQKWVVHVQSWCWRGGLICIVLPNGLSSIVCAWCSIWLRKIQYVSHLNRGKWLSQSFQFFKFIL
jgi:hypothetical protein